MKNILILCFITLFCIGCGETLEFNYFVVPMYEQKKFDEADQTIILNISSEIEPVAIEPSFIRKVVKATFGWVPLIGDILELPLDVGSALIPNLPASEIADIPDEASISDPDIQEIVTSIKVTNVYLKLTPENEIPKKVKDKKCFIFFECWEQSLDFINEIRIYIAKKGEKDNGILIAKGTQKGLMLTDSGSRIDLTTSSEVNLRPYVIDLENYEIRTLIRGKLPRKDVYIQGGVSVDVKIKLNLN